MKRVVRSRERQSLDRLKETYERLLAEQRQESVVARSLFLKSLSEDRAESERKLAVLEKSLEEVRAKVVAPSSTFGLLENLDASILWLVFFGIGAVTYDQYIKAGLPWLYVCFHLGTFALIIRSGLHFYLLVKNKVPMETIRHLHRSYQILSGLSCILDIWVQGTFNYLTSPEMLTFLTFCGCLNLISGSLSAVNSLSDRIASLTKKGKAVNIMAETRES